MFKTILLAYDGSEHAQNALATAVGLVKIHDAKLHIVHTPQIDTPPVAIGMYGGMMEVPPTMEQIRESGEHIAKKVTAEAKAQGVDVVKTHIGAGSPSQFVLEVAENIDADLIVMGRRGLGSFTALALGSVSQSVAHGAKCACLTVI